MNMIHALYRCDEYSSKKVVKSLRSDYLCSKCKKCIFVENSVWFYYKP